MKLLYYNSTEGNFGDDLNPWMWPRLFSNFETSSNNSLFVGIGTILDSRICGRDCDNVIIFGAGVRSPFDLPEISDNWDIVGVRGPLSAEVLNLPKEKIMGDPAYLLRDFISNNGEKKHKVSYIPHMSCPNPNMWRALLSEIGVNLIDIKESVELVIQGIVDSELIITEAMHGAIAADAFRVPWIPVRIYTKFAEGKVNDFKWADWIKSMDIDVEFYDLPPIWESKGIKGWISSYFKKKLVLNKVKMLLAKKAFLSSDAKVHSIHEKLKDSVELVKNKYFCEGDVSYCTGETIE